MKASIIDKLRSILMEPIDNECKVVYLLAECRKLLETYPPRSTAFALKLYCHWALHVDLNNPKTTLAFLRNAEKYAGSVLNGSQDIAEENRMLREFAFLESFRRELEEFLTFHQLPTDLCTNNERWHEFLTHYSGVIEDGSISCRAQDEKLVFLREVEFKRGREARDRYLPFDLLWTLILNDGRKLEVEVAASSPTGHEMIAFGVKLA